MALTDQERQQAITDLETSFKDYAQAERDRIIAERDFLLGVLDTRVGGIQELSRILETESAVFAFHEIDTFLEEAPQ